ncbi:MAG: DUF5714 domain-containing protein [Deltaproteobacteria bacterium]|jgi:hypothetical protein|nr:DUF5714 domain-containing protein [Deltaproteobacteria bacterium]
MNEINKIEDFCGNHDSHASNCLICGSKLQYLQSSKELTCFYCGKKEKSNIVCANDESHYVCDDCHNISSISYIKEYVIDTAAENPFEIVFSILENKDIPMLGCHHSYILTGAVLAGLKNKKLFNINNDDIEEAFFRLSKQAVGGYCGLSGVCGIVPACGVIYSILTGAVCGKDIEQKITMSLTSSVSSAVYELTGPSCCKAYMFKALEIIISGIYQDFGEALAVKDFEIKCGFVELHPHGCRKGKCPYYSGVIFNVYNNNNQAVCIPAVATENWNTSVSSVSLNLSASSSSVSSAAITNVSVCDAGVQSAEYNNKMNTMNTIKYTFGENKVKADSAPC